MAISASVTRVTGAGEVAAGLTDAVAMRPTYIGRDASHASDRGVARHSDCTAVNHYETEGKKKKEIEKLQIRYIYSDAT